MLHLFLALLSPLAAAELETGLETQLAISYWRLGLISNIRPLVRAPMWEEEGNVLRQNTGITFRGDINVSPAYARAGGRLTVSPLAIVDLTGYAYYDYYFGNFGTIVSYDTADANYGNDDAITAWVDETGRRASGAGYHAGGALTLKARAGDVIVLLNGDLGTWRIENPGLEGDYFFERESELMMTFGADTLVNTAGLVLYELIGGDDSDRTLRVGVLNTYRATLGAEDSLERVGPIVQYQTGDGKFSHTLISQAYLMDRAMPTAPPFTAYVFKLTL